MAHLPNLGSLCLEPTGVMGHDAGPTDDALLEPNSNRLKKEYADALKDEDPGLQATLLTWSQTYTDKDRSMLRSTWTFYVGGLYEIVVRFPRDYPFSAPYYYIKTFGEVQVSMKEYLHVVAEREGGETLAYVQNIFSTWLNVAAHWHPGTSTIEYVKRIINDPMLARLLVNAPEVQVHDID
jgi:hypothetical protein